MRLLVSALFLLVTGPSLALGDMQLPGHPRPRILLDDRNDTIRGFIFGSLAFIVVAALLWLAWWGIRSVRRRKSAKIAEFENTPC